MKRTSPSMPNAMFRFRLSLLLLLVGIAVSACKADPPPPTPSPGGGSGESITGRERLGWDQTAGSAAEVAAMRFAIYVDGTRSVLADVSCATTPGPAGYACSGRLPTMAPGTHTLELASFTDAGGLVESARSAPLIVTVAGSTAPAIIALQAGSRVTTTDGVLLTAELLAGDLQRPNDLAVAPDGRILLIEETGGVRIVGRDAARAEVIDMPPDATRLLSLALAPDFSQTGHVFITSLVTSDGGDELFRVARYRIDRNRLVDRMIVLSDVKASRDQAAVLRFGPDGKLYAAFDDSGSPESAERMSEWNGKILRLEADGRTPDDQPAASPVFWSGLRAPRSLDWDGPDQVLWTIEAGADGIERLRAIGMSSERPRRTGQRAYYVLPRPLGARTMAFHKGEGVAELAGNLFIAASEGGYILRVRFNDSERTRAISSERLLEGMVETVRAVASDRDGALYFCTDDSLWRLTFERPPRRAAR